MKPSTFAETRSTTRIRLSRWRRRTVWYLREFLREIGFGGRRPRPLWLSDNPFLTRAVRQSVRGPALYLQCMLLVAALAVIAGLGWNISHASRISAVERLAFGMAFQMSPAEFLLAAIATIHWVIAGIAVSTALSRNARDLRRGHWLGVVSTTAAHRPELVLAESIASMLRRLCVLITPFPLYVILLQISGASAAITACFFGLLAAATFVVMPVPLGLTALPVRHRLFGMRMTRRVTTRASMLPGWLLALALTAYPLTWIPGAGGWVRHLFTPLNLLSPYDLIRYILAFPYVAAEVLSTPLPFFAGSIPPWIYLFPTVILLRIAAVFEAGADVTLLEGGETADGGAIRRAQALTAACSYVMLFLVIGYAWRPCILSGDTASLIQSHSSTSNAGITGLFLLLITATAPIVMLRILKIAVETRSGRPRRLMGMARRWSVATLRAVAPMGTLYAAACLCGGANPFPLLFFEFAPRAVAAVIVTAVFAAGLKRMIAAIRSTATRGRYAIDRGSYAATITVAGCAIAVAALLDPSAHWRAAAAAFPLYSWIQVFPQSGSAVASLHNALLPVGIHLAPPPPYATSLMLPLLVGLLMCAMTVPRSMRQAPEPAKQPRKRLLNRHRRTPDWLAALSDNPVFLRDLALSMPRSAWQPFGIALAILGLTSIFTWLDIKLDSGRFFASFGVAQSAIGNPLTLIAMIAASIYTLLSFIALLSSGMWVGERMLADDYDRGSLGALLITPLKDRQVVPSRLAARALGMLIAPAIWTLCAAALVAIAIADPANVGFARAWIDIEIFSVSVACCGIGAGALISTWILRFRWLRGTAVLGAFALPTVFFSLLGWISAPASIAFDEIIFSYLAFGLFCSVVFCLGSIGLASFLFRRLRRGDIDYGDQPAK